MPLFVLFWSRTIVIYIIIHNAGYQLMSISRLIRLLSLGWVIILVIPAQILAIQPESPRKVLPEVRSDTSKVRLLITESTSLLGSKPEEALTMAAEALILSQELNFMDGKANALKGIGLAYYVLGDYLEALNYWKRSMQLFDTLGNNAGVANMLSNIGAVHFNQGDDANALDYYLQALRVAESIPDSLRIVTVLVNIGAVYFNKPATHDLALKYYLMALPIAESLMDQDAIGTCAVNLGEIYFEGGQDSLALFYFDKARLAYEGSANLPYSLANIGKVYARWGDYKRAVEYQSEAIRIARGLGAKLDMARSLVTLAETYVQMGDQKRALMTYLEAKNLALEIGASYELKSVYEGLAISYAKLSDYQNAYKYQFLFSAIKDTLYNIETDKKLSGLLLNFEMEKKQQEIDLLVKDNEIKVVELDRQRIAKNAFGLGLILIIIIAVILFRNYRIKVKTNRLLDRQNEEIEGLLLNILPEEVARELQRDGNATPRYYESASVLFTDFKGFTTIAEGLSPELLVEQLNRIFSDFDDIIQRHNLEKIKTIGDAYMCAGGIPSPNTTHPGNIIDAGLALQAYMREMNDERRKLGLFTWELRVGIHTGPLVAGVVGKKKYAYDIWGSTVNIASRMESNGEPGRVNISEATYEIVKDRYACFYRGKIHAKNIGDIDMYFVEA